MDNRAAKFMFKEIDERLAKRRRPLPVEISKKLDRLRIATVAGHDITDKDDAFLIDQYYRATEPKRLKWI